MDINTLLLKAKVAEPKGPGCWECPYFKSLRTDSGKTEHNIFCSKHNATIHDRLEATYFDGDRKKEYCVVQCDEPQVMKIEKKSW